MAEEHIFGFVWFPKYPIGNFIAYLFCRGLMFKKEFDTSYVGFMKDGAQWLVDNTDVKLVGKTWNFVFMLFIFSLKQIFFSHAGFTSWYFSLNGSYASLMHFSYTMWFHMVFTSLLLLDYQESWNLKISFGI